jgi:hypothetical protein
MECCILTQANRDFRKVYIELVRHYMAKTIRVPNVELKFEQLLTVIRQLDEAERIQIAKVLTETQMDVKLSRLIEELANTLPVNISDEDINAEIHAIRQANR